MSIRSVQLSRSGGIPEVEFIIGDAQLGVYRTYLWDENNASEEIGHGNNVDNVVDRYPLRAPADLENQTISWEILIQAPSTAPGQTYSVSVIIRQDGAVATGGAIQEAGPMSDRTKALVGFARFQLV